MGVRVTKDVMYLTHGYAVPNQVSSGASTRHYYHIQELLDHHWTVHLITSNQSTISDESVSGQEAQHAKNLNLVYVGLPTIRKNNLLNRMNYHLQGGSASSCYMH